MVSAALDGSLARIETRVDPTFGIRVPVSCPGVPPEVLWPRNTWSDGAAYDQAAHHLAQRFNENFAKFNHQVTGEVREAGPQEVDS
jgi:phosphoenolpyruvate carboxykinase (ATP)